MKLFLVFCLAFTSIAIAQNTPDKKPAADPPKHEPYKPNDVVNITETETLKLRAIQGDIDKWNIQINLLTSQQNTAALLKEASFTEQNQAISSIKARIEKENPEIKVSFFPPDRQYPYGSFKVDTAPEKKDPDPKAKPAAKP